MKLIKNSHEKMDKMDELICALRCIKEYGKTSNYWQANFTECGFMLSLGGFDGHNNRFVKSVIKSLMFYEKNRIL